MNVKNTYKDYAKFYNIFMDNYRDDIDFYIKICQLHEKILEIGCGSGRILHGLCQDGFTELTGIDISPEMLSQAKIKLSNYIAKGHVKLHEHNLLHALLTETFDTVLIPFYTINYIIDDTEKLLKSVHQLLNSSGRLIIDCYYPYGLAYPHLNDTWQIVNVDNDSELLIIKDKRTLFGNIEKRIQIFQTNDFEHKVESTRRFFSFEEIQSMLELSGFVDIIKQNGTTKFTNILSSIQDDSLCHTPLNFVVTAKKK